MEDTIIRLIKLPFSTRGFVLDSPDGAHNIYINKDLSYDMQRKTLLHEERHISMGHLYQDIPVQHIEKEAVEI